MCVFLQLFGGTEHIMFSHNHLQVKTRKTQASAASIVATTRYGHNLNMV